MYTFFCEIQRKSTRLFFYFPLSKKYFPLNLQRLMMVVKMMSKLTGLCRAFVCKLLRAYPLDCQNLLFFLFKWVNIAEIKDNLCPSFLSYFGFSVRYLSHWWVWNENRGKRQAIALTNFDECYNDKKIYQLSKKVICWLFYHYRNLIKCAVFGTRHFKDFCEDEKGTLL